MKIRNSFYLLLILLITSCGSKTFDSSDELLEYISDEDNNYKYSKTVNSVDYVLQYRPTDLMVEQELDENKDKEKIKQLREKYKNFLYFNLSMSMNNKELLSNVVNKSGFAKMVNDLVFNMDKKVHVFTPMKDTLTMTDFVYPRMYGISKSTTILIVYPRDKNYLKEEYLNFTIEDLGMFTGEVKFKIQTKPLHYEPKLNL